MRERRGGEERFILKLMPWITSRDQQKTSERTVFWRIKKRRDIKCPFFSICASLSLIAILFHLNPISSYVLYNKKTLLHRLYVLSLDSKVSSKEWLRVRKRDQDILKNNLVAEKREWELNHEEGKEEIGLECHVCFTLTVDSLFEGRWWEEDSFCRALFWLKKRRKRWSRDEAETEREKRIRKKENQEEEWPPMTVSLCLLNCLSVYLVSHSFPFSSLRGRRRSPTKLETSVEFRKREKLL